MGFHLLSFFKGLFSSRSIVETGLKGLDSAFFTDQEKSSFMLEWLKASAPMAIARRFIAVIIAVLWCLGVVICGGLLYVDSPKFEVMAEFMDKTVSTPFSVVMGFYFLAHVVGKLK